ncbi:putative NRPS-like protein biosynthetic cluster [Arthroderma sp. PD_2]|nr:putative NRPS-like protein biosynthetic cluster [Arthroderma sp. PD_2]
MPTTVAIPGDISGQPLFTRPPIKLDKDDQTEGDARTLPELVEFHATVNPKHVFCKQAQGEGSCSDVEFVDITFKELKQAVLSCQQWLRATVADLHLPREDEKKRDGIKGAPVAIFMDSHVTLVVYIFALMGMGVPAVLLSTRLSPTAVKHLLEKTGCRAVLASPRLRAIANEASELWKAERETQNGAAAGDGSSNGEKDARFPSLYAPASFRGFLEQINPESGPETIIDPLHYVSETDRNVLILHSSGTTGLPKPIYTSHRHYLNFALCHELANDEKALLPALSTSPFFHGFGLLPPCLSLGIGKPFCVPAPGSIPTGLSTVKLLRRSGAKSLLTVPSILEEIALLPDDQGIKALQDLHFVVFGGGLPKEKIGEKLSAAGVKLLNHYGTTETGPLAPLYIPKPGYDWHYFKLRADILQPLRIEFSRPMADSAPNDGHWQLSLQPLGSPDRFHVQDILVAMPGSEMEFSVLGRSDDLICLATGEKVRPSILESMLVQSEAVKTALAFGDGQLEIGVLVEPMLSLSGVELDDFKSSLWPIVEEANQLMDSHAGVSSLAAIVTVAPGSLPRSDKGTILRREAHQLFREEISQAYGRMEDTESFGPVPRLQMAHLESGLRSLVYQNIGSKARGMEWSDNTDFFELGMDSLLASKFRRLLIASLPKDMAPLDCMDKDFVYRHSSVARLAAALRNGDAIHSHDKTSDDDLEALVNQYSLQRRKETTVIITGSTGSIGAHLLVHLAKSPEVFRIICINRVSNQCPYERQRQSLQSKGLSLLECEWAKIKIFQTDCSRPQLGLPENEYRILQANVTHIIHNAWPMNFKLELSSFHAQFRALQNLLLFAREVRSRDTLRSVRVLFISSISVVGHYNRISNGTLVPEIPMRGFNTALCLGYAKAKFVCEKIIERTRREYPEIEAGYVRVGQVAGSRNGFWNQEEHFVALVASSQKIGKLPNIEGTLSWLPVDLLATTISDILFASGNMQLVYHLENPVRQSWHKVLVTLAAGLNLGKDDRLTFVDWITAVASASDEGNPAKKLVDFFVEDFERMSRGDLILTTEFSRKCSPTLQGMGPVPEDAILRYLGYWRSIGLIT